MSIFWLLLYSAFVPCDGTWVYSPQTQTVACVVDYEPPKARRRR